VRNPEIKKVVMVTAAQKIIKNSNHLYVRNVLHIKLVKLQSIWKSGSDRIWLRPDLSF